MFSIVDEVKLKIIFICHLAVVLFVTIIPFSDSNYLLFMHSIIVPFVMLHWMSNNNLCALTLVEKEIRKRLNKNRNNADVDVNVDDCFTCKIIEPVYDFKNNNKDKEAIIYTVTTVLWLISLCKLYTKYKNKKICSFRDLFII